MITSKADCVVDASIAIKLFIEQEDSDLAESLLLRLSGNPPARFAVPDLFYVECANVFMEICPAGRVPRSSGTVKFAAS